VTSSARALDRPSQVDAEQVADLLGVGFSRSPIPALLLDGDLTITAANRSADVAFRSGPQSLLGRCLADVLQGSAQFIRDAAGTSAGHLVQELELVTASGALVSAEACADAVVTASGQRFLLMQLRDVTVIRCAERALAASELRYQQLANSLPDSLVMMFDHNLRVQFAFGEAIAVNGYNMAAMTGRLVPEFAPANAFALVAEYYRGALAGRNSDFEYLSPVSGRRFRVRVRPFTDPVGVVIGGLALFEDVTDDRSRRSQLEQIHRLSRLGSCWYDLRAEWVFDEELLGLWGLESAVGVALVPSDMIVPEDATAVVAAHERLRSMGGRGSLSYRLRHGMTGEIRHLQCTFESTVEDGVLVTATATHLDVTEAVATIEMADLLRAEAGADQRAILLRRISDELAAAYSGPEGPLHSIADLAAADLNAAAVLRVLTPDLQAVELDVTSHPDEHLRVAIAAAMTRSRQCFEPGPIRDEVIRQGRIVSSDPTIRPANHSRFVNQTGWRFEHSITAPMRHNGLVLGLFCVLRIERAHPFETGDQHLVQVLADRAGSAIAEHRVRADLERAAAERLQELTEQQRELLKELAGMEIRERSHMAESIHDAPIQLIVAAAMRIDTLRLGRTGSDEAELDRLAALLESSVDWLRNLIQVDLAAPDLTHGIGGALRNLADGLFDEARPLQIVGPMNVNLSPPATAAAYRILREALTNAHKHAHATNVSMRIDQLDSMVVFSVTDDGVGTASTTGPGHLGMATMRARAEAEGGQLHIHSAPGAGMTTVLTLPITAGL